jgi:hypothetical protein
LAIEDDFGRTAVLPLLLTSTVIDDQDHIKCELLAPSAATADVIVAGETSKCH